MHRASGQGRQGGRRAATRSMLAAAAVVGLALAGVLPPAGAAEARATPIAPATTAGDRLADRTTAIGQAAPTGAPTGTVGTVVGDQTVAANGTTFDAGSAMASPSGAYVLSVQSDGNVVLADEGGAVSWQTDTAGNPGATLVVQTDNNLVVYAADGATVLWSTESHRFGTPGTAQLALADTGALTLDASGAARGAPIWAARGNLGNTLSSGSTMYPGDFLASDSGDYYLSMNFDGVAAVVYWPGPGLMPCPMWVAPKPWFTNVGIIDAPPTFNIVRQHGSVLTLGTDGNITVTADDSDQLLWQSGTAFPGADLSITDSGNLALVLDDTIVWSTGTDVVLGPALCVDQELWPGQQLRSYGGFGLQFATIGPSGKGMELDLIDSGGNAISHVWKDSSAPSDVYLIMEPDGNLVVYPVGSDTALWSSGTSGTPGAIAVVSYDGILEIDAPRSAAGNSACASRYSIWSSLTDLDCQFGSSGGLTTAAGTEEE